MNMIETSNEQPRITMRAFFAMPEVIAQQEIQKLNRHGSEAHRAAYLALCQLADKLGAGAFIKSDDY